MALSFNPFGFNHSPKYFACYMIKSVTIYVWLAYLCLDYSQPVEWNMIIFVKVLQLHDQS